MCYCCNTYIQKFVLAVVMLHVELGSSDGKGVASLWSPSEYPNQGIKLVLNSPFSPTDFLVLMQLQRSNEIREQMFPYRPEIYMTPIPQDAECASLAQLYWD